MLPDLLLRPRRIRAGPKNSLHLRHSREHNLARHKPPNTLRARRARQTSLVGPELAEKLHRLQRSGVVDGRGLDNIHVAEVNHFGHLREKWGVEVAWIEADRHDGGLVARNINVYEMELGFAAVAADRVIRRCVDVPALEVHGNVVVCETRVRSPVAVVLDGEGGAVSPVVEVPAYVAEVVVESGNVVDCETVAEREGNGRLLGPGLAEAVGWIEPEEVRSQR
jgi:hypothetical protein